LLRQSDEKRLRQVLKAMRSYEIGVPQGSLCNPAAFRRDRSRAAEFLRGETLRYQLPLADSEEWPARALGVSTVFQSGIVQPSGRYRCFTPTRSL
jgi:hypothetical protein